MERKLETKIVKRALIQAGFTGVRVGHGVGTSHGWLYCHINQRGDFARTDREVVAIAQAVTGRHGDYDGNINVFIN